MSKTNSMKPVLIFDFDGTIADSMAMVSDIAGELLPGFGRPEGLSKKDIKNLRSMTIPQGLKYLGIPAYKLPKLALLAKAELSKRIEELQPIQDMVGVLKKLHEQGSEMGIVTSNSNENVAVFLRHNELKNLFSFIDTGVALLGKTRHLKQTLKRQKLKPRDCVYVGDEIRDIEAAKSLSMDVISVTWGMNEKSALKEKQPTDVVDTPEELLDSITKIEK